MKQNKHWQSFEELNNDAKFLQNKKNEFAEELPLVSEVNDIANNSNASRRDFLKVLGFSLGAATLAAGCEIPVKKVVPYVVKPETVTPSIATWYASTFLNGSDYESILVKTREGRPIKIEGNEKSSISRGATSAKAQAAVVSLYDGARLTGARKGKEKISWEDVDKEIVPQLANASSIAIVTPPMASPSTKQIIEDFKAKYPNTRHVAFSAISYDGIATANEQYFGKKMIPTYDFSKAKVIVSIGADFLGSWISSTEFVAQYVSNRKVSRENPTMSKHWQFESIMTTTGGKADYRYTVSPSEEGLIAIALHNELAKSLGGTSLPSVKLDANVRKAITKAALDLKSNKGQSLVVAGSNDVNIQLVVNAINDMLGSYGNTINKDIAYNTCLSDDAAMAQLVGDMNSGRVGAVIFHNVNPAYNYHKKDDFVAALSKVKLSVSLSDRADETASLCTYICPNSHFLESWGDAEPKTGHYSLMQPTISPLFDTRQVQETFLAWMGSNTSYYDYLQNYWETNIYPRQTTFTNFQSFWDAALHDGVFDANNPAGLTGAAAKDMYMGGSSIPAGGMDIDKNAVSEETTNTTTTNNTTENLIAAVTSGGSADISGAANAIKSAAAKAKGIELVVFENSLMGDGRYANNPFLHETPEPISKVCWDNYLAVSKKMADENGWKEYDVVEVSADGHTLSLPIIFQPGLKANTVAIPLGYGRTKAGSGHCNVGGNAFPFVSMAGGKLNYHKVGNVTLNKVGSDYPLPRTQSHHTLDDTHVLGNERPIVREAALANYEKNKWSGNAVSKFFYDHNDTHFFTLYGEDPTYGSHQKAFKQGHHWNMSIDLNTCVGCGACVTACNIENNVPIVGAEEVYRAHEMHWLRIDRYYSGDDENPNGVTFMPMMCQHCDNAPCENVCPVAATNHSSEGLNQMAYNRCIGTRYCANNCPFKVRRFNWYDYQGADSFYANTIFDNDEYVMMDDLSRMVLNPDVTVRSRGVMEKCSFCVQRLQVGKLEAKKAGRPLEDGDIKTACQQACAAGAITFGDINNKKSAIANTVYVDPEKKQPNERSYVLLEEYHVLPSVSYLTKIVNKDVADLPDTGDYGGHDDHSGGHGHDDHGDHKHGDGHDHDDHDHDDHSH